MGNAHKKKMGNAQKKTVMQLDQDFARKQPHVGVAVFT